MWLDGLYMAEPFRAEYASISHHPEEFADITQQFVLMEQHARDPKTGLLYHGWDAVEAGALGQQANRRLARILGARHRLVHDGPRRHARLLSRGRPRPRAIDRHPPREAAAIARFQDKKTGLWYTMMNKPGEKGNYFESSSACMFVYASPKACAAAICRI
jgi:unsaturated rhamnogalacturonyl hydrolase